MGNEQEATQNVIDQKGLNFTHIVNENFGEHINKEKIIGGDLSI